MNNNKNLSYDSVTIEQAADCDLEKFNKLYFDKHKPVLIKGGAKHWPAYKKWSLDYLIEAVGDYQLELRDGDDRNIDDYDGEIPELQNLGDYFKLLKDPSKAEDIQYARQSKLLFEVPSLKDDIIKPIFVQESPEKMIAPYIPENEMINPMGWFGPEGTYSETHWDMEHNIFVQLKGSKRFILISPDDAVNAYPSQYTLKELADSAMAKEYYPELEGQLKEILNRVKEKKGGEITQEEFHEELKNTLDDDQLYALCEIILQLHGYKAKVENPDYDKHPNFRKVQPLQAIVEAGDILYVPLQWRHAVRSLSTSFSLNWFFLPSINEKVNARYIILQSTLSHLLAK